MNPTVGKMLLFEACCSIQKVIYLESSSISKLVLTDLQTRNMRLGTCPMVDMDIQVSRALQLRNAVEEICSPTLTKINRP